MLRVHGENLVRIAILKEFRSDENRVAMTPQICTQLKKMGHEILIEKGAGDRAHIPDSAFEAAGAKICQESDLLGSGQVFIQINVPTQERIKTLPEKSVWVSLLYHRTEKTCIEALNQKGISAFSLDAIPRISRAQSMDVLSSQANLAGYRAVIDGAALLDKIFPMLMTAAGTVSPSKVLIFGVGVAGLQAIATAKRLGAIVEATDVRPETKEQVQSLGGKFIEVTGASVGSEGGYAKEASAEYRAAQRAAVNKSLAQADLVITTALVPGKKAPVLIDQEQLGLMKKGAVVVDMAAEQGGNCHGTKPGETIEINGVRIFGAMNLPSKLAANASELLARNLLEFFKLVAPKGEMVCDLKDEIIAGCLICHQGEIRHAGA
jgi:NAD(P) transhydrogenase subunit alpha